MDIKILDKDFNLIAPVPVFNTLIWTRRYLTIGVYELHAPTKFFKFFRDGKYVYRSDRDELGVINEFNYKQDKDGKKVAYAKGFFSEFLLTDRVVDTKFTMSGTAEIIMRDMVDRFIINPTNTSRKIEQIVLGALNNVGETIRLQCTGDNLGEKLYDIGNTQGISPKLNYDYLNNELNFVVWKGKDRRESQTVNSPATFSNSFFNIKTASYTRNDARYKNFAYVAGEGEGVNRTVIEVDLIQIGDDRHELYVDARDLKSVDENGVAIPEATYLEMLRQRGLEKLQEYAIVECVNAGVDGNANLIYRTDFDLGDLCTYVDTEIGIEADKRITEIEEVYEGSNASITIIFGNDETTSVRKIIKREAN